MFAPQPFPATGPYSVLGAPTPSLGSSVPLTDVSALLDSRANQAALGRVDEVLGTHNSCRLSACGLPGGGFDMSALGRLMGTAEGSIQAAWGELNLTATLLSLLNGASRVFGNVVGAVGRLLDRFLSTDMQDLSLVRLASRLVDATSSVVNLFGSAIEGLFAGKLAGGLEYVGDMLSGALGRVAAGAGELLDDGLSYLGGLASTAFMKLELAAAGISIGWPPALSLDRLAALNPGRMVSIAFDRLGGLADKIKSMNLDTIRKMAGTAGAALSGLIGSAGDSLERLFASASNSLSFDRLQGLSLVDGLSGFGFTSGSSAGRVGSLVMRDLLRNPKRYGLRGPMERLQLAGNLVSALSRGPDLLGALLLNQVRLGLGPATALGGAYGALRVGNSLASLLSASTGFMAAGCALQNAMGNALRCMLGGSLDLRGVIESLLESLECRRSTMANTGALTRRHQGETLTLAAFLAALLALLGRLPDACNYQGNAPLGACS